ncbi:MAG TPA: HD domain-containing phosphohydrolase [Solirubrobacteraceae bacterium]|nr:HD domain-containing phosphohydrolase [Solirubrobacteraceae bacterium]
MTDETNLGESLGALRRQLDTDLAGLQPDERSALREAGPAGAEPFAQAPGRILVVDDDATVRRLVADALAGAGYDVHDVASGWEARQALEHNTIALLLTEVSMPRETGLDLIRFTISEHPATATLLMSALEDPGIARAAIDLGAYGFLSKPVSRSAVLIGVMNALQRRDAEARERAERAELEHAVAVRTGALAEALARLEGAAEQGRRLQVETIERWAQAAEYREPGIARHVKRMSRYCGVLGRTLGLQLGSIELASVLHDVGKSRIPDSILLKPGPLTADERLAIETHADIGYEMLRDSGSSVLDLAAMIARTHHEKFDGSGYPRGLAGAEIPIEGRIAAVADVFDALTCDRAYRQAWSLESTVAWMTRERGKHFDPTVLDALLTSMDEIQTIRSELTTG